MFDGRSTAASSMTSGKAANSATHASATQGIPTDPEHYDNLVRGLVGQRGWGDADLEALAACMKQCRNPPSEGSIRNAAVRMNEWNSNLAYFQEIYSQIPGFSQDDKWMRRMGAAIERRQKAAPQDNAATAAPRINIDLHDQEEADLQRALAESSANYLENHYANSAEGVKKFRENMKNWGIDIVPNEGGRHSNSCLIVSMIQQATGEKDPPEAISQALAIKKEMARASEGELTIDGLVDPASTKAHMECLRKKIAEKYNVLIDPHIVEANHDGNPVLVEPREPLPGHVPVLIFNQGAHFEAMQFTASGDNLKQRHEEAFTIIKTMSNGVLGG